jgi:hypothetical protein
MDDDIYASAPSGVTLVTEANMRRIIDMQIDAFPNVRKVMFVKTRPEAVVYALSASDKIGWRVDCLGKPDYFDFPTHPRYVTAWSYMRDRWKTAPVIVEFCTNNVEATYATALNQVRNFHIASVGNGNFDTWASKNSTQRANLTTLGKTAGYRFQIKDVTVPETWTAGAAVNITSRWENVGVAPHYEGTHVKYKLYSSATSAYVWDNRSSVDLQALLPTGGTPVTYTDRYTLPDSLVSGTYQLRIIVYDPAGYRKPLKLAIGNRQSDGSYILGTVDVAGRNNQPAPTPRPTAGPTSTAPQTVTYNPVADTYVSSSSPDRNYGDWTTGRANNSPTEITYLRFDLRNLSGRTINQAKLRVRVSNGASGNTTQNVKIANSNTWNETGVTYRNRPGVSTSNYGAFHGGSAGEWTEVDLTSLIRSRLGTVISIAVVTNHTDSFAFYTRDSANKPQLNIVVQGSANLGVDHQVYLPGVFD